MKNRLVRLFYCILFALILVVGLYAYANYYIRSANQFIRLLPPHPIGSLKAQKLPASDFYIAGLDTQFAYLAKRSTPGELLSINLTTFDTIQVDIKLDQLKDPKNWLFYIDDNIRILSNYLTGDIIPFDLKHDSLLIKRRMKTNPIQQVLTKTDSTIVIKTFDLLAGKQMIQQLNFFGLTQDQRFYPDQQTDSIYSQSGIMAFDSKSQHIFYIHHYWNNISILNAQLNKIKKAKSIDPKDSFTQKIFRYGNEITPSMRIEGQAVNQFAYVDSGRLFIHSLTPSNNQSLSSFQDHWTIDVYETHPFKYQYSFYLQNSKSNQNKEFRIKNNYLYLLRKNSFIRMELLLPDF